MKIDIRRVRIESLDPSIDIFNVEVDFKDAGIWMETFATEAELKAFHTGIKVGIISGEGGLDGVPLLQVPMKSEAVPVLLAEGAMQDIENANKPHTM